MNPSKTETEWAIENLRMAGFFEPNSDYDGFIGEAVKELLEVLQKQGHSGYSHDRVVEVFRLVAKGKPLTAMFAEKRRKDFKKFAEANGGGVDDEFIKGLYPYPGEDS